MSLQNLRKMYAQADLYDRREGLRAYERYHQVMHDLSEFYLIPLDRVVAAFVSLSPNTDYVSNLRSTMSVLQGVSHGWPVETITTSGYIHCKRRAYDYASGREDFLTKTRGPKITAFYHNLLNPHDQRFVTVDGHVCAAWHGKPLTMKEALIRSVTEYREIAHAIKELAFREFILPNQYQAIVWFARKRILRVKYQPQMQFGQAADDLWHTYRDIRTLQPFARRKAS